MSIDGDEVVNVFFATCQEEGQRRAKMGTLLAFRGVAGTDIAQKWKWKKHADKLGVGEAVVFHAVVLRKCC